MRSQEQTERIEALRGLIERLSAPDLTLSEANVVRGCVFDLLEPDSPRGRWDRASSSTAMAAGHDRGDGAQQAIRPPGPSMRVAG